MIETVRLTKKFGDLTAVDSLNLHVEKGEIYGFLGPNGAGKTTTIMMILGLLPPTEGEVRLFGKSLSQDYFNIKRRIGVLAEVQYLYEEMTALEYLRFFGQLYQVENVDERIRETLGRVNLYDRRNELLKGYSRGMKQKLGLARALLHDPEILLLDEPVSALDPYGIKEVRDILLEENAKGKTILISSHILSEVERICHRVGIMNKGRLLAEDTMAELRRRLTEEVELTLELEEEREEVVAALKELPFVVGVNSNGKQITVKTRADQDYRGQVSATVSRHGGVVIDLRRHEMSLEEAFVTITERTSRFSLRRGRQREYELPHPRYQGFDQEGNPVDPLRRGDLRHLGADLSHLIVRVCQQHPALGGRRRDPGLNQSHYQPSFRSVGLAATYLGLCSSLSISRDRDLGTMEVLFYGPVDSISYVLGKYFHQLLAYLVILVFSLINFYAISVVTNVGFSIDILGIMFLSIFLTSCMVSFGILLSVSTRRVIVSVVLFLALVLFFLVFSMVHTWIMSIAGQNLTPTMVYVRVILDNANNFIKWISPVDYFIRGMNAVFRRDPGGYALSILSSLIYSLVLLALSVGMFQRKGVRR